MGIPAPASIGRRGTKEGLRSSKAEKNKLLSAKRRFSHRVEDAIRTSSSGFGHVRRHFLPVDVIRPIFSLVFSVVAHSRLVRLIHALFYVFLSVAVSPNDLQSEARF